MHHHLSFPFSRLKARQRRTQPNEADAAGNVKHGRQRQRRRI
ncbi:hypothetical protein E2C01_079964 [Portunus trituberculatus]|uniref:Uncharacterized protein n=1 Tax=Portunus trituberculatus TaxID=210409 RepID=A0A5B7II91_PORTR|nr:hypothetical protein [Portunus trituberculatus]